MEHNYLMRKLKQYGYTRKISRLSMFSNKPILKKDFKDKSLNHTRLANSIIKKTNFNNAALTGSYFNNCEFHDCDMNMADFEYCEFYKSLFTSQNKLICSFNESNFLDTEFKDVVLSGCSFSGSYFENCLFDNVTIEFTTFENVIFRNCRFRNMDMKVLNFNYVEFEKPQMEDVILPLEQIPHTIGLLKYCIHTTDKIRLGSDTLNNLSIDDYVKKVIPLLKQEYEYTKEYFPLANIYLAQEDYQNAFDILHQGLGDAVSKRDFRTLKFYCKLIVRSQRYSSKDLHGFYNFICRLSPYIDANSSLMRSYVRNIGEIKNILFSSTKKAALHMTFFADYPRGHISRIGEFFLRLLDITRMEHLEFPNISSVKIERNSPLLITADVSGEAENIACLLPQLLSLSHMECDSPLLKTNHDTCNYPSKQMEPLSVLTNQCLAFFNESGINLTVVEYYLENCAEILYDGECLYYYNNNLYAYDNLLTLKGNAEWNAVTVSRMGN